MRAILMLVMMSGCMYFGDDEPGLMPDAAEDTAADDAAAPVDAEECKPSLPECWELGCAVGALPVDCPREDDPSICYCDAVSSVSGWCRNQ